MNSVKKVFNGNIDNEISRFGQRMETLRDTVNITMSLPELYLLAMEMKKKSTKEATTQTMEDVLTNGLTSEYFKIAEGPKKSHTSELYYSDENYSVYFSTFRVKEIRIRQKRSKRRAYHADKVEMKRLGYINEYYRELIPIIDKYLEHEGAVNFIKLYKKVKETELLSQNLINNIKKLRKTDWKKLRADIEIEIKENKTKIRELESLDAEHEARQLEYVEFLSSLKELDEFKEHGWVIRTTMNEDYNEHVSYLN